MKKEFEGALKELERFKERVIREEAARYNDDYKKSKFYREPTLRDALNDAMARDFESLDKAVKSESTDTKSFIERFDNEARDYGRSWYDEDLGCVRCGYEYETRVYVTFRNIAASATGEKPADWEDYYEGYGTA